MADEGLEKKKLALIRILQILHENTDATHSLTQSEISDLLEKNYGIFLERKAIARNIALLNDAGYDIQQDKVGCYLRERQFDDAELRLLIDGVLCSKYIPKRHSEALIEKLCSLSNKYFRAHVKHVKLIDEWGKTDNVNFFYNLELIDSAIEQKKQIKYSYNKYGIDKKLHKTSTQVITPYQMLIHNQHYYLMGYSDLWHSIVYHHVDRMTDMMLTEEPAYDLRKVQGYKNGISYKELASARPYMYSDKPELIELLADVGIIDQIVEWFGKDIKIHKTDNEKKVRIFIHASPKAMTHWALQYIGFVEVVSPEGLRARIKEELEKGLEKYTIQS